MAAIIIETKFFAGVSFSLFYFLLNTAKTLTWDCVLVHSNWQFFFSIKYIVLGIGHHRDVKVFFTYYLKKGIYNVNAPLQRYSHNFYQQAQVS